MLTSNLASLDAVSRVVMKMPQKPNHLSTAAHTELHIPVGTLL